MPQSVINAVSAGATTEVLIAADPTASIEVYQYSFSSTADCTVTWKSGSTSISGPMSVVANGGFVNVSAPVTTPGQIEPLLKTAKNEALGMTISAAATVGGHLVYRKNRN